MSVGGSGLDGGDGGGGGGLRGLTARLSEGAHKYGIITGNGDQIF